MDYKTKSKIGHDLVRAEDDHIAQINMYAWLVTRELPKSLGGPVVVDTVEIEYFAMEKISTLHLGRTALRQRQAHHRYEAVAVRDSGAGSYSSVSSGSG